MFVRDGLLYPWIVPKHLSRLQDQYKAKTNRHNWIEWLTGTPNTTSLSPTHRLYNFGERPQQLPYLRAQGTSKDKKQRLTVGGADQAMDIN